jgi:hypothetical protein
MFRQYPAIWLVLLALYLLLTLLLSTVPWVGVMVAFILKPVFNVGFLAAAWSQQRGQHPQANHLFAGFKSNLYALIPLGVVYWVGMMLALGGSALGDHGILARAFFLNEVPSEEYRGSYEAQLAMMTAFLCSVPVFFALWFSPAIVVFDDAGPLLAIALSARAALANWRALMVFGLALFALAGVLPVILVSILAGFSQEFGGAIWIIIMLPLSMILMATVFISDYVSYRQVFHHDAGPQPVAE